MALLEYKCPQCGGKIEFVPGTEELACPYCDSVINVEALKSMDEDLAKEQKSEATDWGYDKSEWNQGEQDGMAVYSCNSCGGEIVGDETLGATHCPFCDNPVVMTSKFSGTLRPDKVIPFKYDKNKAVETLKRHYLGKKLLPKVFKDKNHIDEVKGIYVPFWLFDADIEADIEYSADRVRTYSDSKYNYTETSTYRVLREGDLGFNDVPVDGSTSMDDALMESIEPFFMSESVDFQTAYLSGYFANKYDVDYEKSFERAHSRIKNSAESAFSGTISGYTSVSVDRSSIDIKGGKARYALLPVWILNTSWQGNKYVFAMNGQTGKLAGDLPVDKKLKRKIFWGITLGITTVVTAAFTIMWAVQGVL